MSSQSAYPAGTPTTARERERAAGRTTTGFHHRSGWLTFAGAMLCILGVLNIVYGIAAIDEANFYVADARYVFSNLNTWGWIIMLIGVLQFFAAFSIWNGTTWGVWVGIISASLNAIAQLLFLPAYPLLSLALFSVDILVLYGLIAYGFDQETETGRTATA
jgi:hypothetical protein